MNIDAGWGCEMAVDKDLVDSMLGPFRDMVKDIDSKGITNKDVDEMKAVMAKMNGYAASMDDMISFSTKLTTEGLFVAFSNAYSRVMSAAASSGTGGAEPEDASLLAQSLAAYEQSYNRLKDDPTMAHIVPPVKRAVEIAKSGVTYPVFLRQCEEEKIFERMKNGDQRPVLEFQLECAREMGDKLRSEMYSQELAAYDRLSAASPCGQADNLAFELARKRIEHEFEPMIAEWDSIIEQWEKLHWLVIDWLDAHCSFAPYDQRWVGMTPAITQYNIRRTKEKNPARLVVRERIFRDYHGLGWNDVWTHPTWIQEQAESRVWFADECIDLMKRVYPVCRPGSKPPSDCIAAEEAIHAAKKWRNPKNIARFGDEAGAGSGYRIRSFEEFVKARRKKR